MSHDDAELADRLDRHWDCLIQGFPASPADADPALDPARAATIRRLQTLDLFSPIANSARERVWQAALARTTSPQEHPMEHASQIPRAIPVPPANGRLPSPRLLPERRPRRAGSRHRWWPALEFAAMITLIVGLVAGYLAGGRSLLPGSSPSGTGTPQGIGGGASLDLPAPDGALVDVILRRLTLAPGARWEIAPDAAAITWVESGALTFRFPETAPQVKDVVGAGDLYSTEGPVTIRNDGEVPAVALQGLIDRQPGEPKQPPDSGATVELIAWDTMTSLPGGPAYVSLRRLPLAPGESLNSAALGDESVTPAGPSTTVAVLESGTVTLAVDQGEAVVRRGTAAETITAPAAETSLSTSETVVLRPGAVADLRNTYDESATMLVLSIASEQANPAAEGSPAAGATASGVASGGTGQLHVTADYRVPSSDRQVGLFLRRLTLDPGSSLAYPFSGTALHAVEQGAVTVRLGDDTAPESTIGAGATQTVSGDGDLVIRNAGASQAVLLQAIVAPASFERQGWGPRQPPDGVIYAPLTGVWISEPLYSDTATVGLSRTGLDGRGAGWTDPLLTGPQVIAIESGRLGVTPLQGHVLQSQGTPGRPEAGYSEPLEIQVGTEFPLDTADAVFAQPGAGYSLRNPDDAPLSLLILSVDPTPEAATPAATPASDGWLAPVVPDPAECQVEPRSIASIQQLIDQAAAGTATPDPGLRHAMAEGVPADADTITDVTATMRELAACLMAGDDLRAYALFSDNAILLAAPEGGFTQEDVDRPAPGSTEGEGPESDRPVLVTDVRLFPDGRAGAVVDLSDEIVYVTFVRSGERWLIDVWDDQTWTDPLATPSA